MPAWDDVRLHVLVCGTSPIPDVFLVPPGDEPLRQHGSQWASADIAAETALMQCTVHNVTITAGDVRHALRAAVDDEDELSAPAMSVVVLCPSGPDWPTQRQSVEIANGEVGEIYRPPPDQKIDALVKSAVANRGRFNVDTWIRPGWKF